MTRKEAKNFIDDFPIDVTRMYLGSDILRLIDSIYDDFEEQSKSCCNCDNQGDNDFCGDCIRSDYYNCHEDNWYRYDEEKSKELQ